MIPSEDFTDVVLRSEEKVIQREKFCSEKKLSGGKKLFSEKKLFGEKKISDENVWVIVASNDVINMKKEILFPF